MCIQEYNSYIFLVSQSLRYLLLKMCNALWKGEWQRTPVSLPGESMDRGAWRATVLGVAESDTAEVAQHSYIVYVRIIHLYVSICITN